MQEFILKIRRFNYRVKYSVKIIFRQKVFRDGLYPKSIRKEIGNLAKESNNI